ncbi:MAG: SGNH/GDSL hydrolase family protein [Tenericutes bacterium]|nr:SGNH/GDSL hydrolase family protein [Mycoplasmatota bacterium]
MKIKKILFVVVIVLLVFLVYKVFLDNQIYYLNLNTISNDDYSKYYKETLEQNDKLEYYNNDYNVEDYRITDLIRFINENTEIVVNGKKQTINHALIKADIITVWVGMNELSYKINTEDIQELYRYSDTILMDLEELFLLLRKFSKEKIIFMNFYNPGNSKYDEVISYLNSKMNAIAIEYEIDVLDVSHIVNNKIESEDYKKINSILEEISF